MVTLNINTLNRGISSNSNMLKSVMDYESSTNTKIAVGILSIITLGGALGIYALYSYLNGNEKQHIFAKVASAVAHSREDDIHSGRLEVQSESGLITFEQVLEHGQEKVKVTVGGESTFLNSVTTLKELQNRLILDMLSNSKAYDDMGVSYQPPVAHISNPLPSHQINRKNIVKEESATGGNISDVTKVTYKNNAIYYFKPIISSNDDITAALVSGIPDKKSRYAERSIFAYVMSELLDFHIVPKTGLSENRAGKKGYIQEKAPGLPGQKCLKAMLKRGELDSLKSNKKIIKQLVELQLLDALTGQVDRHMNNYFIDTVTNKVTCIDNDASGGFLITHPNNMIPSHRSDGYNSSALSDYEKKVVSNLYHHNVPNPADFLKQNPAIGWSVFFPPVMDQTMVDKFKNLTFQQLTSYMSQLKFNENEIAAACSRLLAIQFHINVLEQRQAAGVHSIIEPDEWALPETIDRLFPQEGRNVGNALSTFTTYLSRDMAYISDNIKDYQPPSWIR